MLVGGRPAPQWNLAELGQGNRVHLATEGGALLLFGHSPPFEEPMIAHGPFVMNTREEISQAIRDYQSGKFGDPANLA